jgi:sigma-B regulation protein RsbU (phosphoserine phosphatase)
VPAAILMNGALSLAREALLAGLNPAGALARLTTALLRAPPSVMFVTMLVGILDEESGLFTWASAGHPAPILALPEPSGKGDNVYCHPWPGELALGIRAGERYSFFSQRLLPGEALLLYSDGAEEALNVPMGGNTREDGEFFGEKRLAASLARHMAAPSAAAHLEGIRADLLAHMGGTPPHDDITLMVLRRR